MDDMDTMDEMDKKGNAMKSERHWLPGDFWVCFVFACWVVCLLAASR